VTRRSLGLGFWWRCAALLAGSASAYNCAPARDVKSAETPRQRQAKDDGSLCEFQGRGDLEVAESVGTGALQPSIRRVYRVFGNAEQRRRVLVCREVDTNLDGTKDLVRKYDDRGEALEEQADSNYDGKIDTWVRFTKGRIAQIRLDVDGDGKAEEIRYYQRGRLSRIQRDSNGDGKPDIWEIYANGHLERMGVDVDFDGRVDRWNRDVVNTRAHAREAAELEQKAGAKP
jgi:hypothetical protein